MESQTKHHIGLDDLDVYVWVKGTEEQPWEPHGTVTKYQVEVESPEGIYVTSAWGSINDHENGVLDHEGIGYMVLDELLSAAYDSDEFFRMATESDGGRERAQAILSMIETAESMIGALERNADAIDSHR